MKGARPGTAIIACACALASGCGGQRPSALEQKIARAQRTHEFPAPKPPPERAANAAVSAVAAIRSFVTAYINWNAQTVSADMQALAARSVGQARSELQLAAAQTAGDYELQRGGIANSGAVEAVVPFSGHRNQYLVVTLESTSATNTTLYEGLRPAWHVAIATVREVSPGKWVLSGWQPES